MSLLPTCLFLLAAACLLSLINFAFKSKGL